MKRLVGPVRNAGRWLKFNFSLNIAMIYTHVLSGDPKRIVRRALGRMGDEFECQLWSKQIGNYSTRFGSSGASQLSPNLTVKVESQQ